jgi:hypothetical protein
VRVEEWGFGLFIKREVFTKILWNVVAFAVVVLHNRFFLAVSKVSHGESMTTREVVIIKLNRRSQVKEVRKASECKSSVFS